MKHVQERLPDYVMDELGRVEKAEVDAHLQECTLCREEYDSLLRLWAKLGSMPEIHPPDSLRVRFVSMLEAYQEGLRHAPSGGRGLLAILNGLVGRFWPSQPAVQVGLSMILLVAGFIVGTRVSPDTDHDTELAHLRGEVRQLGGLLTVSLLNQQSASERLRGVSWTSRIEHPDERILEELLRALKYDPNVNVRLASIDALAKFVPDASVRAGMLDALPRESSPLVQIALIDMFVREGVIQSAAVLEDMMQDPSIDPAVKQRIEAGIRELSAGGRSS